MVQREVVIGRGSLDNARLGVVVDVADARHTVNARLEEICT